MKTIMFANQKGGVGKSTIAINLAIFLSKNFKVILMDTDPQASILSFLKSREKLGLSTNNIEFIGSTLKYAERDVTKVSDNIDFCIIDTPGQANSDVISILSKINHIIIPVQPSSLDIEASKDFLTKIFDMKRLGHSVNYKVLINGLLPNSKNVAEEFKEFLRISNIDFFESIVSDRKIYKDSIFEGQGIIEVKDNKVATQSAVKEFKEFISELYKWIEIDYEKK